MGLYVKWLCGPRIILVTKLTASKDCWKNKAQIPTSFLVLACLHFSKTSGGIDIYSHYYYTCFNGLYSRTTWVSHCHKGKTSLDWIEARDDGILGYSGISWTICKQSAPRSRQITTPTPHHSIFYWSDALPDAQPTVSKHWRHLLTWQCISNAIVSSIEYL